MANHQRDEKKERFWRRVLVRRERSGLSVRAFCRKHGMKESAYYFWRRELKQRAVRPRRPGRDASRRRRFRGTHASGPQSLAIRRRGARARFVPIEVPPGWPAPRGIELVRPDGVTLRVPVGCDAESLRMVWGVLEATRC